MPPAENRHRSRAAAVVFALLDPLPYGMFAATLVFDAVYAGSGEILWDKAAAWLVCMGLVAAVIPRLINLVQVWITSPRPRRRASVLAFWLDALAIVAAILNAFVHSRDAYGSMPDGLWLSVATVVLLVAAHLVSTLHASAIAE